MGRGGADFSSLNLHSKNKSAIVAAKNAAIPFYKVAMVTMKDKSVAVFAPD